MGKIHDEVPAPPSIALFRDDEYKLKATLEGVEDELVDLFLEREKIETRICKLQGDLVHLSALCGVEHDDPAVQLGLTDSVRYILAKKASALSVDDIVEELKNGPHDVSGYKNLHANISTVLRRLQKSDEVGVSLDKAPFPKIGNVPRYTWAGFGYPILMPSVSIRERIEKLRKQ